MDIRSQLRGAWRVDCVIVAGVETPKEDEDEHFLWFNDEVIITGNADAAWDMPYVLLGNGSPAKIDITRNDRWEPWTERALIKVEGDALQLCSAGSAEKDRPVQFESSVENGWTLYLGSRCNEPVPT
jgi:uncharacterized protein (TIGR03067 family)